MAVLAPTAGSRLYASRLTAKQPVTLKAVNVTRAINSKWADLWNTFQWEAFIQKQIDVSLAMSGTNCIKVTASGISPEDGFSYPADAILRARIEQFCGYCRSKGAVVYWNLAAHANYLWAFDGSGYAASIVQVKKVAGWLENIPNVVAIDVVNEVNNVAFQPTSWTTLALAIADLTTYFADIRKVTSLPLTASVLCQAITDITGPYMAALAPLVDFHDFHPYYTGGTPAAADVTSLRAQSWYRGRYLVGECGSNVGQGLTAQTNFTTGIAALGTPADSYGSVLFCACDYDNSTTANEFGVYDTNVQNGPRTQISTPWAAGITGARL